MRFTLVGHSCLFVETPGGNLIVDPWLFGSVGWRSWWHYPPIGEVDPRWLRADFLYLTHHHPDHFHYPTLRRMRRDTRVFVGRFGVDVMRGELEKLGFTDVTELAHGEPRTLAPGLEIASYQYGFDDTALVIRAGDTVIFDLNDAKIRGRALDRMLRRYPNPTFLLKTFSWAQAYPHCHTADDPADLQLVTRETPMLDFLHVARAVRPRYAIPFASLVAFLHPETRDLNRHAVTPGELCDFVARHGGVPGTEVVPLDPGDGWDCDRGFLRSNEDWWSDREVRLERLRAQVLPKIERAAQAERARPLEFDAFASYFTAFARALPLPLRRAVVTRPIVFHVPSSPEPYWAIDVPRARVTSHAAEPDDTACVIRIPEGVLADAIEKRITHFAQGSMRIRTHLRRGGASQDLAFWGLIMIWEIGYLPLRRVLRPRFLAALWRRRHEALDAAALLFGRGSFLERMAKNFAPPKPPLARDAAEDPGVKGDGSTGSGESRE